MYECFGVGTSYSKEPHFLMWQSQLLLTFKGRMLRLRHAACIPWWPNVTFT